jgi:hypothetical protein
MNANRNPAGRRGEGRQAKPSERRVLVVDVGGTNVKVYLSGTTAGSGRRRSRCTSE